MKLASTCLACGQVFTVETSDLSEAKALLSLLLRRHIASHTPEEIAERWEGLVTPFRGQIPEANR
jgi:hypothetical protein